MSGAQGSTATGSDQVLNTVGQQYPGANLTMGNEHMFRSGFTLGADWFGVGVYRASYRSPFQQQRQ